MKMKFCMIGCGRHATSWHGPAQRLCANGDVELAACCDRDESRAVQYQEAFGFQRHYQDLDTMLEKEKPDAVCLVLPTHLTGQVAERLLDRAIPLLMEKPPAMTREGLERLIAAADRGKAIHQVAFNRRSMPVLVQARALLDEILPPNEVLDIHYEMLRNDRRDDDFSTTAIHAFDAALFLARSPYRRAAFSYRELPQLGAGVTQTLVDAEFACGTRIHLSILPVCGLSAERVALHGINHSIFVALFEESLSHWQGGREQVTLSASKDPTLAGMGFTEETEAFFEALRQGKQGHPSLKETRQSIALMEAMHNRQALIEWPS